MKQEIVWKNAINLSDMKDFSRIIKIDIKPKIKQKLYKEAIKAIGSKRKLARSIGYGYRNIDEWIKGNQDSIGLNIVKQLCDITSISLDNLQRTVIKIKTGKGGYFLKINFPFKVFNQNFVELLIHVFGEGSAKLRAKKSICYYNTDIELVNKVKMLSNNLFHPQKNYAIRKIYSMGDEIKCPNNKRTLARKDELSLSLPNFIAYIILIHCSSLKEFKTIGISNLILQVPDYYIPKIISALIEDEGCVRCHNLVILTTKYKIVADVIKTRLEKLQIKSKLHYQRSFYDLVITDLSSLKLLKTFIKVYNRKRNKIGMLIRILSRPKANYYEVDKEILQFLSLRKKKYNATEVAWNIKRRKWIVSTALQRLQAKNLIKKESDLSRHGSFLYYNNNLTNDFHGS